MDQKKDNKRSEMSDLIYRLQHDKRSYEELFDESKKPLDLHSIPKEKTREPMERDAEY